MCHIGVARPMPEPMTDHILSVMVINLLIVLSHLLWGLFLSVAVRPIHRLKLVFKIVLRKLHEVSKG
jgi:hypothetical protein